MTKPAAKKTLEARVRYDGGGTEIVLVGVVDEPTSAILEDAFAGLVGNVSLNLKGVDRITSYGLGVLMRLLTSACKAHAIEFVACSETVVDQLQMLHFSRYGTIASMFLRFECESCGAQNTVLVDVKKDLLRTKERGIVAPSFDCHCGGSFVAGESLDFVAEHVRG